jgi:hypothetical protein
MMHPVLMYLLLDAAAEIHGGPGWVNKAGEFPAPKVQDFPLSDQAERFYKTGRPFLLDYLPFWVAVFLDRIVKILFPVAVILFPLIILTRCQVETNYPRPRRNASDAVGIGG